MNYHRVYESLVERAKSRTLNEYRERHHIVPRCMGGTNDSSNLVDLTPREHHICHQLLVKMNPGNQKLLAAAILMTRSGRGYGWLRAKWSEKMRANNPGRNNPRCGTSHHYFGKKIGDRLTDSARREISRRMVEKNPMSGIQPWNHPRCKDINKKVWLEADKYYDVWRETGRSYGFLSSFFGYEKSLMSHHNLVKRFKSGWIPSEDPVWLSWKNVAHTKI